MLKRFRDLLSLQDTAQFLWIQLAAASEVQEEGEWTYPNEFSIDLALLVRGQFIEGDLLTQLRQILCVYMRDVN